MPSPNWRRWWPNLKLWPQLTPKIAAARFREIIQLDEQATHLAHRLNAFANLCFAQDTQDQAAQSLLARVEQFMADLGNRAMFFSLWWKDLPEAVAQRLLAAAARSLLAGKKRCISSRTRFLKPKKKS